MSDVLDVVIMGTGPMIKQRRMWAIGAWWCACLFALSVEASELGELVKHGDVAAVASALAEGAAINEIDGVTALYIASENGNAEMARLLIDQGADVNLPGKFQRAPIGAATKGGHAEIVKLLLDNGADPDQSVKSQTPLHMAAENGCLECVMHLVDAGADVNALTSNGGPPIHFAKRSGHQDIVSYLLEHGAGPPATAPISPRLASADAELGKQTFEKACVTCHIATPDVENSKRPNLWGIVGRPKASESDVDYSPVLKNAGGSWTWEELNAYIQHPALTLPGTDMNFVGLPDEKQRADLLAYLRSLSVAPLPLP